MTASSLADELEVAPRTILRDVDAMTEAGLPIIAHRGPQGGIELGFNYRTRLTGLDAQEAEALAVVFAASPPAIEELGITDAAARAIAKLKESFPDRVRTRMQQAEARFRFAKPDAVTDPRIAAIARAIRENKRVTFDARGKKPRTIVPIALQMTTDGWTVLPTNGPPVPISKWADINISRQPVAPFAATD